MKFTDSINTDIPQYLSFLYKQIKSIDRHEFYKLNEHRFFELQSSDTSFSGYLSNRVDEKV